MVRDRDMVESNLMGVVEAVGLLRQQVQTEREELFLRIGLSLGHFEEAVATGDDARAEAHARKIAGAYQKLSSGTGR